MEFVDIDTIGVNKYPRKVSLGFSDKDEKFFLSGNLEHGTEIIITQELLDKLQKILFEKKERIVPDSENIGKKFLLAKVKDSTRIVCSWYWVGVEEARHPIGKTLSDTYEGLKAKSEDGKVFYCNWGIPPSNSLTPYLYWQSPTEDEDGYTILDGRLSSVLSELKGIF